MEFLKIAHNGQWSLHKASKPGSTEDYNSFRSLNVQGQLPKDHGTKGQLHNVGNARAPRAKSKERMDGKVPVHTSSALDDRNPGVGP